MRGPGGAVGVRGGGPLSMTTWLIIINVGVFILGALLPTARQWMGDAYLADVDRSRPTVVQENIVSTDPATFFEVSPILDRETGEQVGIRRYREMGSLDAAGHFSTFRALNRVEIWRFLTFQFLHADLTHLVFNMIGLYFFGPLVERHLGSRRLYLAYYLTCGVVGATLYMLLNLLGVAGVPLPGVLTNDYATPLIGASAGVFGILMAAAYVAGDATMLVMLLIPMKVRWGAYLFFGIAVLNLITGRDNAGGEAAHVGGALAGFYFIRKPHHLIDFFDDFLGGEKRRPGRSARRGGPPRPGLVGRAVDAVKGGARRGLGGLSGGLSGGLFGGRSGGRSGGGRKRVRNEAPESPAPDAKLDAILEKVRREGVGGLTDAEKKYLADATDRRRG